jgi:hypothetical protein
MFSLRTEHSFSRIAKRSSAPAKGEQAAACADVRLTGHYPQLASVRRRCGDAQDLLEQRSAEELQCLVGFFRRLNDPNDAADALCDRKDVVDRQSSAVLLEEGMQLEQVGH